MTVRQRLQRKGTRESLTFNIDVRARERQNLKHCFHLVPLASSVKEGLSFDQDTHNGQTHPERRAGREERNPKLGCARCPAHCPPPYTEHTNKIPQKCPQTPKKKKPDLKKYDPPMRMRINKTDEKRGRSFKGEKKKGMKKIKDGELGKFASLFFSLLQTEIFHLHPEPNKVNIGVVGK